MHGLVQKMVCHILNQSYMVNCNEGLTKAPDMQEWTADLKKGFLDAEQYKENPEWHVTKSKQLIREFGTFAQYEQKALFEAWERFKGV